jgi:hypothetical protein
MSNVIDRLRGVFGKSSASRAPVSAIASNGPALDHADELPPLVELEPGQIELTEGQSFVIQYRDASGAFSTRSITVWALRCAKDGVPILVAKCHLRNATRYFRIDRIEAIADYDGVVIEPIDRFLRETFGLRWSPAITPQQTPAKQASAGKITVNNSLPDINEITTDAWTLARRTCRSCGVQLLCAVGLADGEMTATELNVIANFLQRRCITDGITLSLENQQQLDLYVKRMRPTTETIERSIERIIAAPRSVLADTIDACLELLDCEGERNPEAVRLMEGLVQAMREETR